MRIARAVAFVVLTSLSASVPALAADNPPTPSFSLLEALGVAYETNPQLAAARAGVRASDEGVAQANANWRPSIAASGTYGFEKYNYHRHAGMVRDPSAVRPARRDGDPVPRRADLCGDRPGESRSCAPRAPSLSPRNRPCFWPQPPPTWTSSATRPSASFASRTSKSCASSAI